MEVRKEEEVWVENARCREFHGEKEVGRRAEGLKEMMLLWCWRHVREKASELG